MKLGFFFWVTTWIYSTCITWVLGIHFFDWFLFLQTHSFSMRNNCQGRPKPKQKPRCVTGRSGRRSVRTTITSWRRYFRNLLLIIYKSFDTWSSLIQLWIATFILYQYWNAKEWRYHTHISMVAVLSKYIPDETEPPKLIFNTWQFRKRDRFGRWV